MKLVAYDEKPGYRAKDLDDFLFLVENYHEIAGEELFAGQFDDLIKEDFEMSVASARMLGRNMSQILNKNEKLKEKVINTLFNQLKGFNEIEINQMYQVRKRDDQLLVKFRLISETIKGISDKFP